MITTMEKIQKDLHGSWDPITGHHSALYAGDDVTDANQRALTVDFAASYWIENGFPKENINLGLALYGRTFTLANPSQHDLGSPAKGAGSAGTVMKFVISHTLCEYLLILIK